MKDLKEFVKSNLKNTSENLQLINEASNMNMHNLNSALANLFNSKDGFFIRKSSKDSFEGVISAYDVGALSSIFDTITFKGKIEQAPDGSDNWVVWNVDLSWKHSNGGRNGYRIPEAVGIWNGRVTAPYDQSTLIQKAKAFGW